MCCTSGDIFGVSTNAEGDFIAIAVVSFLTTQSEVFVPVYGLSLVDAFSVWFCVVGELWRFGAFACWCGGEGIPQKANGLLSCLMSNNGSNVRPERIVEWRVHQADVVVLGDGFSVVHAVLGSAVAVGIGGSSEHFGGVMSHGDLL